MPLEVTRCPGLPSYGPPAVSFPEKLGRRGREGFVVEFRTEKDTWIGNFGGGLGGIDFVGLHPNRRDAIVIAQGALWVVDPETHTARETLCGIFTMLPVTNPDGWVF